MQMNASPLTLRRFGGDLERLARLPAWERAKIYALADLDLGMRSMIESEVRARIAVEFTGVRASGNRSRRGTG
jgi:hypothetical protein